MIRTMGTANAYLSLREIGRRLGIPPSSVVYYKDRFGRFIPHHGGEGRRRKYPEKALEIFKEIRAMFDKNWSAEQIEETLAATFQGQDAVGAPMPAAYGGSGSGLDEITQALGKISGLLENQALFRAEIDSMRAEVASIKREKLRLEESYKAQIGELQEELGALRSERDEMVRMLLDEIHSPRKEGDAPPRILLESPLVIRTSQGEYLGVTGKTKAFTLAEFIRLAEQGGGGRKQASFGWQRQNGGWRLSISTSEAGERHEHVLDVRQTVTPSRNKVAELTRLVIDGNTVPEQFLLALFKQIKGEFEHA